MSLINPLTAQEILAFLSVPDSDLLDQPLGAVDSNMNAAPESAQELFNTDLSTPALRCVTPNPLEQDAWDEISTDPDEANVKEQSDDSDEPFTKEAHENLTRTDANAAVKHEYDAEDQFHSAMSDTKEPWVRIIPRRGNALENRPVVITLEVLSKHFHESIEMAAKKIGIGKSTMKHVCRRLGVVKWPYTHKGQRRRCPQRASSSNSQSM